MMTSEAEILQFSAATSDCADRRRAGRTNVSPTLVSLLREPTAQVASEADWIAEWEPRVLMAPPRGIALAVAVCIPVWCGIGGLLYGLLK